VTAPETPGDPAAVRRACAVLENGLSSSIRRELIDAAAHTATMSHALAGLRRNMQSHLWAGGNATLDLRPFVGDFDRRTRAEGFHVLHDWDGKADRVLPTTIPTDVVDYLSVQRGQEPPDLESMAIALDYYFLYILALVAMRAWDDALPAEILDRVTALVGHLQGPDGSGHRFADNAETLILIATAHYEPNERGFHALLARAHELPRANRVALALVHAQALGSHLRFAFEVTCGRDIAATRDDNVADYPWLCFSVATLMEEYARLSESGGLGGEPAGRVVEALFNALSADPVGLIDESPVALASCEAERASFAARFRAHAGTLVPAFEALRPLDRDYSPLSLYFNFSHNLVKGAAVDASLLSEAWDLSLNDLFTGQPAGGPRNVPRQKLARTLMGYARARPDTIRGRLAPVIVYDPPTGRRLFAAAMQAIRR